MRKFINTNRVIISAILGALVLSIQPIIQNGDFDIKSIALASVVAVLGVIGNAWKGKTASILGVLSAVSLSITQALTTGSFTWNSVIGNAVLAVLLFMAEGLRAPEKPAADNLSK